MKRLKVLFIDWNNTLSISRFWEQLESPTHALHHIRAPVAESLFSKQAPLKHLLLPWMRVEYVTEQIVQRVADHTKIDYLTLLTEFILSCEHMRFVSEEVPDLITKIRNKGVKVVIATDNMDSFDRWTAPAMKIHKLFDEILNSHALKGVKTDKDSRGKSVFFDQFLQKHNLKFGESVLIDDSSNGIEDINGFGIGYKQIEAGLGLVPALQTIYQTL